MGASNSTVGAQLSSPCVSSGASSARAAVFRPFQRCLEGPRIRGCFAVRGRPCAHVCSQFGLRESDCGFGPQDVQLALSSTQLWPASRDTLIPTLVEAVIQGRRLDSGEAIRRLDSSEAVNQGRRLDSGKAGNQGRRLDSGEATNQGRRFQNAALSKQRFSRSTSTVSCQAISTIA